MGETGKSGEAFKSELKYINAAFATRKPDARTRAISLRAEQINKAACVRHAILGRPPGSLEPPRAKYYRRSERKCFRALSARMEKRPGNRRPPMNFHPPVSAKMNTTGPGLKVSAREVTHIAPYRTAKNSASVLMIRA